jgi:hypothetical protein
LFKLETQVLALNCGGGLQVVANFRRFRTERIETTKCEGVIAELANRRVLRQIVP